MGQNSYKLVNAFDVVLCKLVLCCISKNKLVYMKSPNRVELSPVLGIIYQGNGNTTLNWPQLHLGYEVLIFSSADPKGHVRYCHHLASVFLPLTFHILIYSSETTGPNGAKLGRKHLCKILYKTSSFGSIRPTNMAAVTKNRMNLTGVSTVMGFGHAPTF